MIFAVYMASIGLTASQLPDVVNAAMIDRIVNDEIAAIDEGIREAARMGQLMYNHLLISPGEVGCLSAADVRLVVYARLLNIYNLAENSGGKGITARLTEPPYHMIFTWKGGLTDDDRRHYVNIINKFASKKK